MAYIDVLPLADAKTYLGVDDTSRDAEITRMIETCLTLAEEQTNILVVDRDKEYIYDDGCVLVYDYPINTLDAALATTVTRTRKTGYSIYEDTDTDNESITLNVGEATPANVPKRIVDLALIYLGQLFHDGNIKETFESKTIVGSLKRFII